MLYFLVLIAGFVFLGSYFFFDSANSFLLWASVIVSAAAVALVISTKCDERTKLIALVIFAVAWHIVISIRGGAAGIPSRMIFNRDEVYQEQLDTLIFQSGSWQPGMGLGRASTYSFFPMLPILAVVAENVFGSGTGFQIFANILFPAGTAVLPLLFYVKSMKAYTRNVDWALLAAFVFCLNEQFLFFEASFSYESLAVIFFTGLFFLISRSQLGMTRRFLVLFLLAAIIMTHFWTSFNVTFFLAIFYLSPLILRFLRRRLSFDGTVFLPPLYLVAMAFMMLFAYSTFVSTFITSQYGAELILVLLQVLIPAPKLAPSRGLRSPLEFDLIIVGQAVLLILGFWGFLSRKNAPSLFKKFLFLIGGIYVAMIVFGLPESVTSPVLHRGFFFGFFVISPIVAWSIASSKTALRKNVKALFLVLTVISLVLVQEPWFIHPDFVAGDNFTYSGSWASGHIREGSVFVSMWAVGNAFGAYGRMNDLSESRSRFYSNQTIVVASFVEGNVTNVLKQYDGRYVAISTSTDAWLLRYYVQRFYDLPGQVYVSQTAHLLNGNAQLNRVMNCGDIALYNLVPDQSIRT
jgi:hypothetical protein